MTSASLEPELFADGPDISLALLARRLRVPAGSRWIAERFAEQPAPSSLQALVAVAPSIGLTARAFRGDAGGLAKLSLPAMVHVRDPGSPDATGFAVLSHIGADEVVLEVGPRGTRHRLDTETFAAVWSGVVVTFAASDEDGSRPGALRALWKAATAADSPERAAVLARRLALTATLAAALTGAIRESNGGHAAAFVLSVVLAALGGAAALALLTRRARAGGGDGLVARLCGGRGGTIDCEGVLDTKWSRLLGLDLSALAAGFFAGVALVLALAGLSPAPLADAGRAWLTLVHLAALVPALFLFGVQLHLRRFCPLCLTGHVAIAGGAAVGFFTSGLPSFTAGLQVLPFALIFALALLVTLGAVAPLARAREELGRASARLDHIDASLWGPLAEVDGRPALPVSVPDSPFVLGYPSTAVRLDAIVDPGCAPCGGFLDNLAALVDRRGDRVHVVVHVPTRGLDPAEARVRTAVAAAGSLDAYHAAKERLPELEALAAGGVEAVLDELGGPAAPDALARAEACAAPADALLAAIGDVTPALLVGGKPWPGPLGALEPLLAAHPDVLPAHPNTAGAAAAPADASAAAS